MLLTAIPLLFETDDKRKLFLEDEGRTCLQNFLSAVSASHAGKNAVVLVDDERGVDLATQNNLMVENIGTCLYENLTGALDSDLEIAWRWLAANLGQASALIGISPRSSFLTKNIINKAISFYEQSKTQLVLSATEPRDHPSQFWEFFNVNTMTFLHLLNNDGSSIVAKAGLPSRYTCTKPFTSETACAFSKKIVEGMLFTLETHEYEMRQIPAESDNRKVYRQNCGSGLTLAFIDMDQITLAFPYLNGKRIVGLTLPDTTYQQAFLYEDDGIFSLKFPNDSGEFLRMIMFGQHGESLCYHDLALTETDRFFFPEPPEGTVGVLCIQLNESSSGAYEIERPFLPDDLLWRQDPQTEYLVNAKSGKKICGRQDFVELFIPDGSFFMAAPEVINNLNESLISANVQPYILKPNQSLRVENSLDVLLYTIRQLQNTMSENCR